MLRDLTHAILRETLYSDKCSDPVSERKRIVETAASIVREDICLSVYDCDTCPSPNVVEGEDKLVPDTLKCLIKGAINPKGQQNPSLDRKCAAISHAICTNPI